jgi:hypothetical protein
MSETSKNRASNRPLAIVLGTNEIASAVAVHLHRARRAVILSHDRHPPVIRRRMAFHDALYGDPTQVEGIRASRIDKIVDAAGVSSKPGLVAITSMGLTDLLVLRPIEIIVDARMQKHTITPDFRGLARMTIGLGPGFAVGKNCDLAIETRPTSIGTIVDSGMTQMADGVPEPLFGTGRERFAYSSLEGRWRTPFDIGVRVFKGMLVGHIDKERVLAPIDGILSGIVRDGTEVPEGVKIIEVDPRVWRHRQTKIEARPRRIAEATMSAVHILEAQNRAAKALPGIFLN